MSTPPTLLVFLYGARVKGFWVYSLYGELENGA